MISFTFIASALVLGHVMAVPSDAAMNRKFAGYAGTCTNQTYGITARMYLAIHEQDGTVSGNLDLFDELGGGGPIIGSIEGDQVTFTINGEFGEINWAGSIDGETIHGTYRVQAADGSTENGIWSVSKL